MSRKKYKKRPKKGTKAWIAWRKRVDRRNDLRKWSEDIRARDHHHCAVCGTIYKLQAHHILPRAKYPEFELEMENGITLCAKNHKYDKLSAHGNPIWFADWLHEHKPDQHKWALDKIKEQEND